MNDTLKGVFAIATAIIGVAIIAVLVSKRSNTVNVLQTMFAGFSQALQTAVSPISSGDN